MFLYFSDFWVAILPLGLSCISWMADVCPNCVFQLSLIWLTKLQSLRTSEDHAKSMNIMNIECKWDGTLGFVGTIQSWFNTLKTHQNASKCTLLRSPGCEPSVSFVGCTHTAHVIKMGRKPSMFTRGLERLSSARLDNALSVQHSIVIVTSFLELSNDNQLGLKSALAKAEAPREPTQRPVFTEQASEMVTSTIDIQNIPKLSEHQNYAACEWNIRNV